MLEEEDVQELDLTIPVTSEIIGNLEGGRDYKLSPCGVHLPPAQGGV
jgi:hypothetical protein